MKSKLPNQISDTDLLDLLSDSTVKDTHVAEESPAPSPVKFLTVFNIKPGSYTIKSKALHAFYKKWAGKNAVCLRTFSIELQNYLKFDKSRSNFSINEKDIHLGLRIREELLKKPKRGLINRMLKPHMDKFIAENNLKRGKLYTNINLVHELYWTWAFKTKKTRRIPLSNFIKIMSLYFEVIEDQHGSVFVGFQQYGKAKEEENN